MRRLTLWILGSSIILATAIFQLKHSVVQMEDQLVKTLHAIEEEKKHVHILEAEWQHLNNPQYLQKLATHHLPKWQALHPSQIVQLTQIPFKERPIAIPNSLFESVIGNSAP